MYLSQWNLTLKDPGGGWGDIIAIIAPLTFKSLYPVKSPSYIILYNIFGNFLTFHANTKGSFLHWFGSKNAYRS